MHMCFRLWRRRKGLLPSAGLAAEDMSRAGGVVIVVARDSSLGKADRAPVGLKWGGGCIGL